MAFDEKIIKKVKEKAAFKCCRCQSIGIEVHHIIPQKEKRLDTFDNAAPLCPNCHTWFGDNPLKRKEITQMRNWWYKKAQELYSPRTIDYQILNDINSKIEALVINQDKGLSNLKKTLKRVAIETIEQMTAGTARITASGIANATVVPYRVDKGGISEVYDTNYLGIFSKRIKCPKCGTLGKENLAYSTTLYPNRHKHYKCETCGTEFEA
ncbi:MAG: Restriction endonuclease [Candidatus Roizmanbacteria bacterium GW2011_GWA2_33_33]|uniref:Restriction endonuclease n=2 Tax=Candidatus Roizmaniibacteriota TaxID=1752723 RepID=A0A0G0E6N5_9BACT|nr:MAG: Restriction endonuclease [Candidatus Roizmanbacteria bacterium GW2011_GWA2_33_33]KKP63042.1 MAG: Restriction endonuclease [Candidatus Roizmanbacteria bacterium GW2011_GWC2_34_23]